MRQISIGTEAIAKDVGDESLDKSLDKSRKVKPDFPSIHTILDGRVSEFVWEMYQDKNDNLWFGTNHDGVIHYDGSRLNQYTQEEGIAGSAVREIVEDEEGIIWMGTSGGLTKFDGSSFTNYTKEDGLPDGEIWDLKIDRNGLIWIATIEGVCQFDGEVFTAFPFPRAKVANPQSMLSYNGVKKIIEDSKGNLWFVTDGFGITIYDGKTFTHLSKENGLTDNNVADVFEDKAGNIWIGTYYGGISRYDGNTFINYTQEGLIEGVEVYCFLEDSDNNLWFAVENIGVYKFNGESFTKFSTDDGLATNGVLSIFEDNKRQLWFGTWQGLSLYDGESFMDAKVKEPWTK